MTYTKITSNKLPVEVSCPTSKSHANRALVLAALKDETTTLADMPKAQDVLDMIEMLTQVGINFETQGKDLVVTNFFPACEKPSEKSIKLTGSEGGTTIRFLLPILALGKNRYSLPLKGEMKNRPLDTLLGYLEQLGAQVESTDGVVHIQGPITFEKSLIVDCDKTTQFASALEHLKLISDFNYKVVNLSSSKKYLDLSKKLVQKIKQQDHYVIPPDFSSLGYFLAYGCLSQDLLITNVIEVDTDQADAVMVDILREHGVNIIVSEQGMKVSKVEGELSALKIDGSQCIDLVPTLMFLASFACTPSEFSNVKTLRHKESDRLAEMEKILDAFKVGYTYDENTDVFTIKTKADNRIQGLKISTAFDHRMVMVATLFLKKLGGGEVAPRSCVKKSFPDFFTLF